MSVNVQKLHGAEAVRILGHDTRWDGRSGVDYSNTHISPERTEQNSRICFKGMNGEESARATYERLTARVQALDELHPPKRRKRDRVTMVALEVPAPEGLAPAQEQAFFALAYQELMRFCGGPENISPLYIHRDEVHDYVDPVTHETRTSRVHAHAVGIPYTREFGVNAKNCCSRERLRTLQRNIHDRCAQELGVRFLDGSGTRSRATVEQLKQASERAEAERAVQVAERAAQAAQERLRDIERALGRIEAEKRRLEAERRRLEAEINDYSQRRDETYEQMIDVLQDNELLRRHNLLVWRLQEYYPDTWTAVRNDLELYDAQVVEIEDDSSLMRLDKKLEYHEPWDDDPPIDDIYPTRSTKSRGFDYDR